MVTHPVLVRGARFPALDCPPTILQRTDQEFIPGVLAELGTDAGHSALMGSLANTREGGVLKLFQPVHRIFNVVLVQAACDTLGQPRLDPAKIDSSGLVVRRVSADDPNTLEGWVQGGNKVRGWVALRAGAADADPDPQRRPPALDAGHPEINRCLMLLRNGSEPLAESVAPLFVAPPDVCAAAHRTVLYGLVPVTSSERSESPPGDTYPIDFVRGHLPTYLLAGDHTRAVPSPGAVLSPADADDQTNTLLQDYIGMLRQLRAEFDAFGDGPESQALFAQLNRIQFTYDDGSKGNAGDELKQQAAVLVDRAEGQTVKMPNEWPAMDAGLAEDVARAVKAALDARRAAVRPGEGRFDGDGRQYRLRAFVRVKRPDGCPPQLVWSPPSEPFSIAPWYDSGGAPPVQVTLPPLDVGFLKKLKPNVSFVVPSGLFNFLQGNPKDLLQGKKSGGGGLTVDWICSFSIPIITLCAFIVLYIFLALFDLIFFWLLWIKICLPIPRKK